MPDAPTAIAPEFSASTPSAADSVTAEHSAATPTSATSIAGEHEASTPTSPGSIQSEHSAASPSSATILAGERPANSDAIKAQYSVIKTNLDNTFEVLGYLRALNAGADGNNLKVTFTDERTPAGGTVSMSADPVTVDGEIAIAITGNEENSPSVSAFTTAIGSIIDPLLMPIQLIGFESGVLIFDNFNETDWNSEVWQLAGGKDAIENTYSQVSGPTIPEYSTATPTAPTPIAP